MDDEELKIMDEEEAKLDHRHIIGRPRRAGNQNLANLIDDNFRPERQVPVVGPRN